MVFDTTILDLPAEILDHILTYLTYHEVSNNRLVCKKFDVSCQRTLNRGFYKAEKYHDDILKRFKEQLPRRESERHKHALSTHCDVLTAMDNRLSLLGMTYMKYVELNVCCFIPGKVLDEIFRVLRMVETTTEPLRPHIVLLEFRDITTMAMEHFDEHIIPSFKARDKESPRLKLHRLDLFGPTRHRFGSPAVQRSVRTFEYHYDLARLYICLSQSRRNLFDVRKEYFDMRRKNNDTDDEINDGLHKLTELKNELDEQNLRITELDTQIKEIEQKIAEFESCNAKMTSSLKQLKKTTKIAVTTVNKCLDLLEEDAKCCSSTASSSNCPTSSGEKRKRRCHSPPPPLETRKSKRLCRLKDK